MSAIADQPNELVRNVYDQLGDLLREGDAAFVEEGPSLLRRAISQPGFFDGVETITATDKYTRAKVIGTDQHVIRFMEWPPEYALMPHEHHGRPCFEVMVDGQLLLADMDAEEVAEEEERYRLDVVDTTTAGPGDSAVVDPRENEIHTVYSPVRSRSLHVYPSDNCHSVGYVPVEETTSDDRYERKRFEIRDDSDT
jgi:hypothetical protein